MVFFYYVAYSVSKGVVASLNDVFPATPLGELAWYMGSEYRRNGMAGTLQIKI